VRDQYAGDISDYLKYAFLRALVPSGSRLGVAWYFLPGDDGRPDGRHDEYLQDIRWRALDPDLFDQLKGREHRSVAAIERLSFWPAQTTYHADPVPPRRGREAWAASMRASLSDAHAVFLDPDNGVSREDVTSRKSATVEEVRAFFASGRLGLLIRFPHRVTTHDVQLEAYHRTFAAMAPVTIRTCARVPNAGGGSSPRIRWFTALNATTEVRERISEFAGRVEALPGGSAKIA
jgi:hypothetical protein